MSWRPRILPSLLVLWAIGFGLIGCGESDEVQDLGEWILVEKGLSLTKTLQVNETENFYFGSTGDLAVTSDGHMVVVDPEASNIKVLEPDGTLIDTLGREGRGPGEFQDLSDVQVARGDSLFVYDNEQSRLTVFAPAPSWELTRTVALSHKAGRIGSLLVLENHFVGFFGSSFSGDGVIRPPPRPLRLVQESGVLGDTLFLARSGRFAIVSTDGGMRGASVPFSRHTEVAIGPDSHFYHGRTDSLRIVARAPDGTSRIVAAVPVDPLPVRDVERDSVLESYGGELRSIVDSALPGTKPAFTDLVVADDGRLWVQRPKEGPDVKTSSWWVLHPEKKTIHNVDLPRKVELQVIQDGQAHGTSTTEAGAPTLIRYQI